LPPATRCNTLPEVTDFWQRVSSEARIKHPRREHP
jgi:hypothetical protein